MPSAANMMPSPRGPLTTTREELWRIHAQARFAAVMRSRARRNLDAADAALDVVEQYRVAGITQMPAHVTAEVARHGQLTADAVREVLASRNVNILGDALLDAQQRLLDRAHEESLPMDGLAPIIPLFGRNPDP